MDQLPIALELKDLAGALLLLTGFTATTTALLLWPVLRAAAFVVLVAGAAFAARIDLNIASAYWYRGTTRGFEAAFVDVLAAALLAACVLAPRRGGPRWFWPAGLGPMLVFAVFCLAATLAASPRIFGLYECSKLARGLVAFLAAAAYVRGEREVRQLVLALAAAMLLEFAAGLKQRYLGGVFRVTGTLDHANSLSMYACAVSPVLCAAATAALPGWLRATAAAGAAAAAVTVLLTISRAGIPIFAFVALGATASCVSWRPTLRKAAVAGAVALAAAGLVAKSWDLLVARYGQATLEEEYLAGSGETRGYYFRQAAVVLAGHPYGVGLNNWSFWVSKRYGALAGMPYENYEDILVAPPSELLPEYRYAAPAHNLGVLTVGELGWAGLALLGLVWLRWLGIGAGFLWPRDADPRRLVAVGILWGLIGVFLQSATEWTFRQTQIFLTVHLLAGALAALRHARRAAPAGLPARDGS